MKASDLFVKALEEEGVTKIFAVPGEENLDMVESLRSSSIELVITRHEQGAGFMAATYGRLTGRAGVCMSTLGPGATNITTSTAYAQLGAFPLVVITGQKPIKSSKQGQFQIVDIIDLFNPITKLAQQIPSGDKIPAMVRNAVRLAEEERPGAVLLELPEDIAEEETDAHVLPRLDRHYAVAADAAITEAAAMIKAAKHPILLIGAGGNRRNVQATLTDFVEKTGIYVFATQMGKGAVSERSEQFLGTAALSEGDYVHCAIERADLILNVGHDVVEKPPFFMEPDGRKVIHLNYKSAEIDPVYFPQLEVIGDIAKSLEKLGGALGALECDNSHFKHLKTEIGKHISEGADDPRFPSIPQRIVADVRDAMGDEDIIALDNGIYKVWFARNYPAYAPKTILVDNALATMGAGLPSAMMAALHCPDRNVLAICGDGGFMMNSQEVETAIRLNLNLVVLILKDDAYGMIRWKQSQMGFDDHALTFGNPDFVKYAESYGASGHRVMAAGETVPLLKKAFKAGGVHIVELAVDYSENERVLIKELQERTCDL